jgi:hypothetical protein
MVPDAFSALVTIVVRIRQVFRWVMGRKSPFILPFLLKRRENGGYVYYRCVPADVRSAISGEVLCPWNGETCVLGGNAAIKVSFNTTDFATAHQRWNEVHAQVELVVGAATRRKRADQQI